MGNKQAVVGAAIMAVLAVAGMVSVFTNAAPVPVFVILLVLGVVTLVGVGLWASGRSRRPAMLTAVTTTILMALLGVPAMLSPDEGQPPVAFFVVFILAAVVAVVLVRGELGAARTTRSATAG